MGTPLGPKYIPYTYIDPLGNSLEVAPTVAFQIMACFLGPGNSMGVRNPDFQKGSLKRTYRAWQFQVFPMHALRIGQHGLDRNWGIHLRKPTTCGT